MSHAGHLCRIDFHGKQKLAGCLLCCLKRRGTALAIRLTRLGILCTSMILCTCIQLEHWLTSHHLMDINLVPI